MSGKQIPQHPALTRSAYRAQGAATELVPLYLIRAFVKHLSCPRELVGVRGVLCPRGAGGTRAAGGQVSADSLLGHIIGQATAAGAGCWWRASVVGRRQHVY